MTEPASEGLPLEGHLRVDVAIVGAGFTGLAAALALAQRRVDTCLLDAHHVGWGGSGRAWGQVAASAKYMPAQVEKDLGLEAGARLNQAAASGPDIVFDLIDQHRMQCSHVRSGNLIAAQTRSHGAALTASAEDLQARGYPVELLNTPETQRRIGSRRYAMALFDPRGGALNPLGYARGLARAARTSGAQIHEKTPVITLERRGSGWHLSTPRGSVQADSVILATNAFGSDALFPGMRRAVMPVRAYQAISEPLSPSVVATILPGGEPLNDTRKLFSGVRVWPDGRLHIGVDGPPLAMRGRPNLRAAQARVQMMFPELGPLRWEYCWGGWVDMTPDQYPRIHPLAPGLWSGFGFSGRGIAIGTLMGQDLAALVCGARDYEVAHPVAALKPIWFHAIYGPIVQTLRLSYRAIDAWNDHRFRLEVH